MTCNVSANADTSSRCSGAEPPRPTHRAIQAACRTWASEGGWPQSPHERDAAAGAPTDLPWPLLESRRCRHRAANCQRAWIACGLACPEWEISRSKRTRKPVLRPRHSVSTLTNRFLAEFCHRYGIGVPTRLARGATVPTRRLQDINDQPVDVPAATGRTHLQFRRFAACPICHLHLRSFANRHQEVADSGITEVVFFIRRPTRCADTSPCYRSP